MEDRRKTSRSAREDVNRNRRDSGRVLSSVAEPFVCRYNERKLRTTLENLRSRLETDDR